MRFLKLTLNITVITVLLVILLRLVINYICPYETKAEIIAEYEKSKDILNESVQLLLASDIDSIYIYYDGEKWVYKPDGFQGVTVENVNRIIDIAQKRKYSVIDKADNYIYFQLWSNLDAGRGIAYTLDGNPPTLQFLTKYEKLDDENWYYYEEDFNEWRRRNNEKNSY